KARVRTHLNRGAFGLRDHAHVETRRVLVEVHLLLLPVALATRAPAQLAILDLHFHERAQAANQPRAIHTATTNGTQAALLHAPHLEREPLHRLAIIVEAIARGFLP